MTFSCRRATVSVYPSAAGTRGCERLSGRLQQRCHSCTFNVTTGDGCCLGTGHVAPAASAHTSWPPPVVPRLLLPGPPEPGPAPAAVSSGERPAGVPVKLQSPACARKSSNRERDFENPLPSVGAEVVPSRGLEKPRLCEEAVQMDFPSCINQFEGSKGS